MTRLEEAAKEVKVAIKAKTGPFTVLEQALRKLVKATKQEIEYACDRMEKAERERDEARASLRSMVLCLEEEARDGDGIRDTHVAVYLTAKRLLEGEGHELAKLVLGGVRKAPSALLGERK